MSTLGLIGFVGGLITGISPCIFPVLPVTFFFGTQSARDSEALDPSNWLPERQFSEDLPRRLG